jgi:hypothetical protein
VSDVIHKAWSAVPTTMGGEEEPTDSTGTSGRCVGAVERNNQTNENSPQSCMRESISKVLGTSSLTTPSSFILSPPVSQSKLKEVLAGPSTTKNQHQQPSLNVTARHAAQKTEKEDSICDQLKRSPPRNKETANRTSDKQKITPERSISSELIVPVAATCALSKPNEYDPAPYDNHMADMAALLLLLVFLIVTNLPL